MITFREREILRMLVLSTPEISKRLGISIPTVKTHIKHLHEKLVANNRRELLFVGLKKGYINVDEVITE